MKKYKFLIGFLLFTTLVLTFVRSMVSNRISTDGVMLGTIQGEIDSFKTDNLIYREKIYTLASLNNISSQAATLGFVDEKLSFDVTKSLPIAAR